MIARAAPWALLGAVACVDDIERTIDVSSLPQPLSCLEIEQPELFSSLDEIVAVAVDAAGQPGAWVLARDDPEPEDPGARLFLLRRPAIGEIETSPIDLGFLPASDEVVRLSRASPPGHAHLLRQGPNRADVWALAPGGGIAAAGSLAGVPGLGGIADWDRHLVLLGERSFVIAVQRSSPVRSLVFYAAELEPDLQSAVVWEIPFLHPCEVEPLPPPEYCGGFPVVATELAVGASQPILGASRAMLPLEKRVVSNVGTPQLPMLETHSDVALFSLRMELDSPSGSLLTIPQHDVATGDAPPVEPLALGFDPFVLWAQADATLYAIDPVRHSAVSWAAPFGRGGALLQLPGTAVASEVEDGRWTVAGFAGDPLELVGEFEAWTAVESDVAAIDPAGPGSFLVRSAKGAPPRLATLVCAQESE